MSINMQDKRLHELFEYRDGCLFWKKTDRRAIAGKQAGSLTASGRLYVQIDGVKRLVHRIVWQMHHGECPEFLDHIDCDPLNNKIENLRPATKQQNAMNRSMHKTNKCGIKGIYRHGKKFVASIGHNGVNKYLGSFSTPEQAGAAYAAEAKLIFKEYANV